MEEEAGTESSEEDEVTAAQIGGGATGEDRWRSGKVAMRAKWLGRGG